ncbi:MAG: hypothetical protein M1818_004352 [Claussenomyces sp. TS43310]|nr:MAG: hypothetical protein M1818_004352 [Claussenomyces sp. TS43310]
MARHKEKDDEAGGEGLGHLATRKRLWRDASGNIVNARRPYQQDGAKRRQLNSSRKTADTYREDLAAMSPYAAGTRHQRVAPPSPPTSVPSTGSSGLLQDSWPLDPSLPPSNDSNGDQFDFLCNASWGSQSFPNFMEPPDLPYDDIFKPDTAMSFNAPFTTQSYYTWLFDVDGLDISDLTSADQSTTLNNAVVSESLDPHLLAQTYNHSTPYVRSGGEMSLERDLTLEVSQLPSNTAHHSLDVSILGSSAVHPLGSNSQPGFSPSNDDQTSFIASEFTNTNAPSLFSESLLQAQDYASSGSHTSTPPNQQPTTLSAHQLPDANTARSATNLPVITKHAREGILDIIIQSEPVKPDGSKINPYDPLLSLSSLQHYSDLFFTRFNSSYPLIHQGTFHSSDAHPFYLMAILLLGATYSDKEAHLLAVCVHDIMRPMLQASKEFGTRPRLWMLQTILLVECFGKSRAGEKQHDMSHLYHGMLINLIRRSDCQSAMILPFDGRSHTLEQYWHNAVEAEQKRRLAVLCFMWDTQHAVLFSQSLCMNASELKITLPWDPAIWEAPTASQWHLLNQSTPPPPMFLNILKSYTNPSSSSPVPEYLNALSRVFILHGLMSISWDLQRRDQTSLGLSVSRTQSTSWQSLIGCCYDRWRADFDIYVASVLNLLSFSPAHAAKLQRFYIANLAVYHTAQLILNVDIIDLQICAGAKHIIGRPVTTTDRARSKSRISEWIASDGGKRAAKATWHAGWLFRDGVRKLENWNVDEMFHYPWCLYLASLMCWTFHDAAVNGSRDRNNVQHTSSPSFKGLHDDIDDGDSDWDFKAEMNALISALTRLDPERKSFVREIWAAAARHKTAGLIRCMVKQLNTIRWAVVREGMIVLRGLSGHV